MKSSLFKMKTEHFRVLGIFGNWMFITKSGPYLSKEKEMRQTQ